MTKVHSKSEAMQTSEDNAWVLGVDSGSLTGKAVIIDSNRHIIASSVVQLEIVSKRAVQEAISNVLSHAGLKWDDLAYTVSTGYGRRRLDIANRDVTEISCHAKGARYFYPEARTVIDIGGQDSKVIQIDPSGNYSNFAMNEKCAAGSGKFLEVMARALGVPLDKIGDLALESKNELQISSTCTVFAETEVISFVAEGRKIPDILAAIHKSIANRVANLAGRILVTEPAVMTGGVAKNIGLVRALEKELSMKILVPSDPQIVGAVGAALFALEDIKS
jgi:predicted CoA-substrate-specific enzyme activase